MKIATTFYCTGVPRTGLPVENLGCAYRFGKQVRPVLSSEPVWPSGKALGAW